MTAPSHSCWGPRSHFLKCLLCHMWHISSSVLIEEKFMVHCRQIGMKATCSRDHRCEGSAIVGKSKLKWMAYGCSLFSGLMKKRGGLRDWHFSLCPTPPWSWDVLAVVLELDPRLLSPATRACSQASLSRVAEGARCALDFPSRKLLASWRGDVSQVRSWLGKVWWGGLGDASSLRSAESEDNVISVPGNGVKTRKHQLFLSVVLGLLEEISQEF